MDPCIQKVIDACREAADHLYTKQDMERVRQMAREALAGLKTPESGVLDLNVYRGSYGCLTDYCEQWWPHKDCRDGVPCVIGRKLEPEAGTVPLMEVTTHPVTVVPEPGTRLPETTHHYTCGCTRLEQNPPDSLKDETHGHPCPDHGGHL